VGDIGDDWFAIRKRHSFANPFTPLLKGAVSPTSTGSRIVVRLVPTPLTGGFVALWVALWIAMGIAVVVKMTSSLETGPVGS
jgi:hypothetical protein